MRDVRNNAASDEKGMTGLAVPLQRALPAESVLGAFFDREFGLCQVRGAKHRLLTLMEQS
jgi:hypothetical protein